MLKRLALVLSLATSLFSALPAPALALDIYEPESGPGKLP